MLESDCVSDSASASMCQCFKVLVTVLVRDSISHKGSVIRTQF